jgi:hypothetical protein
MPLTDTAVRNTRPDAKPLKLFDGGGLFLLVTPAGQRYWRFKYRFAGKEKLYLWPTAARRKPRLPTQNGPMEFGKADRQLGAYRHPSRSRV